MKKVFVLLLSLCLIFCFAACSSAPESAAPAEGQAVNETEPEAGAVPEAEPEEESVSLAAGDSGVGPVTLDTPIYTIEVPAGLEYKVYDWIFDEESNRGTINLGFNRAESSMESISLKFTTGVTAQSYEEAIEASIELRNLDTYSDGKFEMGAENTYGPLTYQAYHTSTERGEEDYLVSFLDFHSSSMTVEVSDRFASGLISDPLTTGMLTSITLK